MPDHDHHSSRLRRKLKVRAIQALLLVVFLGCWEFFSGNPTVDRWALVDELFVGHPSKIFASLVDLYQRGEIFHHSWVTLQEALTGLLIGGSLGMMTGIVLGIGPRLSEVVNPFITGAYSVPRLALAPLFVIWFGLGMASKVALVSVIVFFLVFYSTYSGVREVDRELMNVLRVMDASKFQLHRKVTLPSAAVWVIAGSRVSVPYAFAAAVVGELIASSEGLGFLIGRGSGAFNANAIFAAIVLVVALALLLDGAVSLVERRVSRWKVADAQARPI